MNVTSIRSSTDSYERAHFDGGAIWTWILCLGLVVYLSLEGGGYDPIVDNQVGVVVWWVLLLATAVGAIPRGRLRRPALTALGLLALFAIWTALSLTWTESTQKTWLDLARVVGYVGVFALALSSAGSDRGKRILAALATAIVFIAALGLLSRLHASWFPTANQTARLLNDPERLSYPLNYWNAVGALVAIGLPLLLQQAGEAKCLFFRAAAAAAIPALPLTVFFTLSRGGIAASALAIGVYLVFAGDRLPKLITLFVTGVGSVILIAAADGHEALRHGLDNSAAHHQGNELLLLTVVVCLIAGLLQLGIQAGLDRGMRPDWAHADRTQVTSATLVGLVVLVIAAIGLGAPGKVSNAWSEFKQGGGPGSGASRLGSAAGESRYQFWSVALNEENASKPLTGTGSGTFEYWWARKGTDDSIVKDTHSLWMQTLGELGIVGFALIIGFFGVILVGGAMRLLRLDPGERSPPAAALAGVVAFALVATFDWMWQIPAMVVVLLLLATALLGPWHSVTEGALPLRPAWRVGVGVVSLIAIIAIAIPFAEMTLIRQSESDARAGTLASALGAARGAQNVLPGSAAPRLQEALVLEEMGRYAEGAEAARAATERESTNWRNFLVLSRLQAESGEAARSVASYREAKSLYPRLSLFDQPG